MFRFATPWLFLLVPFAVAAGWWVRRRRNRGDARMPLPDATLRLRIPPGPWVRLDRAMPWAQVAVLILLIVAVARPQSGSARESVSTDGVDIVVALDISDSMRAEDFQPLNRLEVARETLRRFIDGRPSDRLGLVVFASHATTRSPLTQDHAMLRGFLDEVTFASKDEAGTAIGMGLATAVNRLRTSPAKSKVVVLLTDGRNNQGQIGPDAAADAARALGVRVYTVGVGTDGEARIPVRTVGGVQYFMQQLDLDEDLLRDIALKTDGRYFRATDPEGLRATFDTIDTLETTEIRSSVRVLYAEMYPWFLAPACVLLLSGWFLSSTRLRRLP